MDTTDLQSLREDLNTLKDTVAEFDLASGDGNGFTFAEYKPEALGGALERALRIFANPAQWQRLMDNCFKADFSWTRLTRWREILSQVFENRQFETARACRASDFDEEVCHSQHGNAGTLDAKVGFDGLDHVIEFPAGAMGGAAAGEK